MWDRPIVRQNKGYLYFSMIIKLLIEIQQTGDAQQNQIQVKQETLEMNEAESKQLILRSKEGIFYQNYNAIEENQRTLICKEKGFCVSSKDGNLLLCGNDDKILLFSCLEQKIISEKPMKFIQNIGFSEQEKFITCVDRLNKDTYIISIFETNNFKEVNNFNTQRIQVYKYTLPSYERNFWPIAKFEQNDEHCFLIKDLTTLSEFETSTWQELTQFKVLEQYELLQLIQFEQIDSFFITKDQEKNQFIVLLLNQRYQGYEQKNGTMTIYDYQTKKIKLEKKIEMAQQIFPHLSPDKTVLLLLAQNSHDQTYQSYYGQMQLFYYNFNTSIFKQVPTYEGPIHDISWSPNSEQFIIISGFMPGYSVLFNKNCEPQFEFGKHHRNFATWNQQNRFVIIAGFGNLSGDIDIWDAKTFQQIGFCSSKGTSFCVFAPDGRNFFTSCVTPRLRVNNNYQVFHYNGAKKHFFNYSHSELYEVLWRPETKIYKDRAASANSLQQYEEQKSQLNKPKRTFQPKGCKFAEQLKAEKQTQGARKLNSTETFGNTKQTQQSDKPQKKYPPGYVPDEKQEQQVQQESSKKKKKRNRKKKGNQEETKEENN